MQTILRDRVHHEVLVQVCAGEGKSSLCNRITQNVSIEGNSCDDSEIHIATKAVSTAQGKEVGVQFLETSVKSSVNVKDAFETGATDTYVGITATTTVVSPVSSLTKQRNLDAIGKTKEDVHSFLKDVIRCSPVEEIATFVESLPAPQWRRLLLLIGGNTTISFSTTKWLEDFCMRCPGWRDGDRTELFERFVFFAHEGVRVARSQLVGMSAGYAVMTALYLQKCILRDAPNNEIGMTDVAAVCIKINANKPRQFLTAFLQGKYTLRLCHFLLAAYGIGYNLTETYRLCTGSSEWFLERQREDFARIKERLHNRPAVLSFLVGQDFYLDGVFSYRGTPHVKIEQYRADYKEIRYHAVLVGARQEDNAYYFLAQTSWPDKVFVEFSGEYLAHSEAEITFVKDAAPMELLSHLGEPGWWEDEEDVENDEKENEWWQG